LSFPAFKWTLAGTSFRWRTRRIFLGDFLGIGRAPLLAV
jgi:hypothetical protein